MVKDNPYRSQAKAVGKRTKDENLPLNLDYNNIICVEHVKRLDGTIDFRSNFDHHISNVG